MSQPPPAQPGMPVDEIDTPALIVELEPFERNLQKMAADCDAAGVRLRPHAKTHKCAAIALRQMALGAVGVCCQKVSEAEALVNAGVNDVLVSNQVVGGRKPNRLAALARQARVGVCVDDAANIATLEAAVAAVGARLEVLVEIDVGAGRCGVRPGAAAVPLAQQIDAAEHLSFAGLQAYYGSAQHLRGYQQRRAAVEQASAAVRQTVKLLAEQGLGCATVAGAGTGSYEFEAASGVYNELQAGSYIFMDADYARNRDRDDRPVSRFEHSLFVLATVISRPEPKRAVLDAGHKAVSIDSGMPLVAAVEGANSGAFDYRQASDEHGVLELETPQALAVGDRLRLIPGHCDPTVNLHDWLVAVRGDRVEALWPVTARGAVF